MDGAIVEAVVSAVSAAAGAYGHDVLGRVETAAADQTVSAAARFGRRVLERMHRKHRHSATEIEAVDKAVEKLADHPQDADLLAAVRDAVDKAAAADLDLAAELEQMVRAAVADGAVDYIGPVNASGRQSAMAWRNTGIINTGNNVTVNQSHGPGRLPPPPPPPRLDAWVVGREQVAQVAEAVTGTGAGTVGITGVFGAGGFGKTTVARMVSADRRVREFFRNRVYMVTVGRDVRSRAQLAAKVSEVTRFVTGDTASFTDPQMAGSHLGRLLEQESATLLVIDDVWDVQQLEPFLDGAPSCVRLVTTRVPDALPFGSRRVQVDQMDDAQARAVLTWKLPPVPEELVYAAVRASGRWPLLLRLANRRITMLIGTGADPARAVLGTLDAWARNGPAGTDLTEGPWDLSDARQRNQAVRASIAASMELLPGGSADRFAELGVFAEDEAIPVGFVTALWRVTAGMSEDDAQLLCHEMGQMSLVTVTAGQEGGRVEVHDVFRDYQRAELGDRLAAVHAALLDVLATGLPSAEPFG